MASVSMAALPVPGSYLIWFLLHLEAGEETKKMSPDKLKTHVRKRRYPQIKMTQFLRNFGRRKKKCLISSISKL